MVTRVVEDPSFAEAWRASNKVAHDEVVADPQWRLVRGAGRDDAEVYVQLASLGTEDPPAARRGGRAVRPVVPVDDASLPIGHADDLVRARMGYDLLERYAGRSPVVVLVLIGLGLLASRRRMQALGWTAFGALACLGLLATGIVVGRLYYLQSLPSGISTAAGTAVFDTVTAGLRVNIIVVAVSALAVLVLTAVLGAQQPLLNRQRGRDTDTSSNVSLPPDTSRSRTIPRPGA